MKLYKGIYLAQTFTCNKDTLTGVAIKIGKYMRNSFSSNKRSKSRSNSFKNNLLKIISKSKILSRFFGFLNRFSKATSLDAKSGPWWKEGLGNLVISIRSGITGEEIKNITYSPEEVSNASDWLMFDFSDSPIKNAKGKVFAIVCYTDKGDGVHSYYKWGYGFNDPYKKGYMYISNDGTKWSYEPDKDFCFISYGKNKTKPNDEKPDE